MGEKWTVLWPAAKEQWLEVSSRIVSGFVSALPLTTVRVSPNLSASFCEIHVMMNGTCVMGGLLLREAIPDTAANTQHQGLRVFTAEDTTQSDKVSTGE